MSATSYPTLSLNQNPRPILNQNLSQRQIMMEEGSRLPDFSYAPRLVNLLDQPEKRTIDRQKIVCFVASQLLHYWTVTVEVFA